MAEKLQGKKSLRLVNRPLSRGGHFESQGNKKLCFCTSSLALDERLDVQNLLFEHCVIKVCMVMYDLPDACFEKWFELANDLDN